MILGIIADTHGDMKKIKATPHIISEFKKRGVQLIVHGGDIESQDCDVDLYGGLPVICALVDDQCESDDFKNAPTGWQFTISDGRVVKLADDGLIYVGHKRPFDFLTKTEEEVTCILNELRRDHDCLRWVFGGHTHFQTYKQGRLISLVNPGAVDGSFSGTYEYAIVDTETNQVVFSRILPTPDSRQPFSIGIISDSYDISLADGNFWSKLAQEFKDRDVSHIIHCGNIAMDDIGHRALSDFQVHYNLRDDQRIPGNPNLVDVPTNWNLIDSEKPTINIGGYFFYVELDLGLKFMDQSEAGMDHFSMEILREYPETRFVICGMTHDALYVGGVNQVSIINPGDTNCDRNFAVLCLPRSEITFGHVPIDPLPPLEVDPPT